MNTEGNNQYILRVLTESEENLSPSLRSWELFVSVRGFSFWIGSAFLWCASIVFVRYGKY